MRQEQFARAVPTLLRLCQPYFHCLEAAARSPACPLGPAPDAVRTRVRTAGAAGPPGLSPHSGRRWSLVVGARTPAFFPRWGVEPGCPVSLH